MPEPDQPLSGKVCLVTGATSGIGAVTARALAHRGATVVLVARNRERSEATSEAIRQESGNAKVDFLVADLASQTDVRRLAEDFKSRYSRLDVLINNAGAMFVRREESADGIEMTLALNHLAPFLLTNLLLDLLIASAPARIVTVSSDAHRWAKGFDFDDPQGRRRYHGFKAYGQSKLANILFTTELARRLSGTGVTANCLHPGFVATNFFTGRGVMRWLMRLGARLFAISPEEGAKTTIDLAASPEFASISGQYFVKSAPATPSKAARDEAAGRRLWRWSEEITNLSAVGPDA